MQVYDTVKKMQLEANVEDLLRFMQEGRQVDLVLYEPKTDSDGYLTWDIEHWSAVDAKRYIRTYTLKGRVLRDSTTHNIYDIKTDFKPEEAKEVQLS